MITVDICNYLHLRILNGRTILDLQSMIISFVLQTFHMTNINITFIFYYNPHDLLTTIVKHSN